MSRCVGCLSAFTLSPAPPPRSASLSETFEGRRLFTASRNDTEGEGWLLDETTDAGDGEEDTDDDEGDGESDSTLRGAGAGVDCAGEGDGTRRGADEGLGSTLSFGENKDGEGENNSELEEGAVVVAAGVAAQHPQGTPNAFSPQYPVLPGNHS